MARSLLTGLFAGVLLAFFMQWFLSHPAVAPLPTLDLRNGSTRGAPFADMLKNPLQIASRALRGVGGYKSAAFAAARSSSATLLQPHSSSSTVTSSPINRAFATSASNMASQKSFLQAIRDRRTIYALNKEAPISDKEIVAIVKEAVLHVPSSFNSQSARLVVLLGAEHDKFWDATLEILKTMVPAEQLEHTEKRIAGFKGGYGSILFFEDPEPVHGLQKAFPIYAHHFPDWSEHTSAMHQYALWVALEAEGFGANLQHYNPIVDRKVQEEWNVPLEWKLRSQLVFGGKVADAGEKEFKPVEGERLFVYGAKDESVNVPSKK